MRRVRSSYQTGYRQVDKNTSTEVGVEKKQCGDAEGATAAGVHRPLTSRRVARTPSAAIPWNNIMVCGEPPSLTILVAFAPVP